MQDIMATFSSQTFTVSALDVQAPLLVDCGLSLPQRVGNPREIPQLEASRDQTTVNTLSISYTHTRHQLP